MDNVFFTMLMGLPGSGKTTYMRKNALDTDVCLDSDEVRAKLFNDENDQTHNQQVFEYMYQQTIKALHNHQSVWYCATNLSAKRRRVLLKQLQARFPHVIYDLIVFAIAPSICKARNKMRERQVPDEVIDRMLKQFQPPMPDEAWNNIEILNEEEPQWNLCDQLTAFGSQRNSHHQLSLYDHSLQTAFNVIDKNGSFVLSEAASYHDVGKIYTQTFVEGDPDAHYYNHEHVSAYYALCQGRSLMAAQLIEAHMRPFDPHWKSPYPEDFNKLLNILHEADVEASHSKDK